MADTDDSATGVDAGAVREQLERILASATFRDAQRSSRLLRFVVEETLAGRATSLKEYTLGVDGLERGAAFDPRVDSTVRVEASRLRGRIDLYYANDGATDLVRLSLPKGSYVPQFARRKAAEVATAPVVSSPRKRWWIATVGVLAAMLLTVVVMKSPGLSRAPAAGPFMRFEVNPALAGTAIGSDVGLELALTADGSNLVFMGRQADGSSRLYVRDMTGLATRELPGTFGARGPFLSPDDQWVGFFADGALKRVRLDGEQAPVVIAAGIGVRGGFWGDDGAIIATSTDSRISRIEPDTGKAQLLLKGDPPVRMLWARSIAAGKVLLFTQSHGNISDSTIEAYVPATGQRKTLVRGGMFGHYLPGGYLLYLQASRLYVVRFDLESLAVRGEPALVLDDVMYSPIWGSGQIVFSRNGTVAYRRESASGLFRLQRLAADGTAQSLTDAVGKYQWPRMSPDGRHVAFMLQEAQNYDLWTLDIDRGVRTRLIARGADLFSPVWTPDGKFVVYSGPDGISWVAADGSRSGKLLDLGSHAAMIPSSISADGHALAYFAMDGDQGQGSAQFNIWTVPIEQTESGLRAGPRVAYLRTPAFETQPRFSPDGRWLAFASDESGKPEIYVRPVVNDGRQWRVSDGGARAPAWSAQSHELLYRTDDQQVRAVSYSVRDGEFVVGVPRLWSPAHLGDTGVVVNFDLAPDGQHVVALMPAEDQSAARDHLVIATGLYGELERLLKGESH